MKGNQTVTEVTSTNSILVDALKLTSAPIITQIFGIFVIPFIARLYSPDAFGLLAAYNSILVLFGSVVNLSYNGAIIIAKTEEEIENVLALSLIITIVITLLSFLIVIPLSDKIAIALKNPDLKYVLWLIPYSVLIWGFMQSFRSLNMREGRFGNLALSGIFNVVLNNGYVIAVGYLLTASNLVMIYGQIFGGIINTLILVRHISVSKTKTFLMNISKVHILACAKKYNQFALIATPESFISRFINEVPTYLIIYFFSSKILGLYALGLRILSIPISLISSSISDVFFQREGPKSKINALLLEKTISFLFITGNFLFIVLGFSGDIICEFAFGQEWKAAGLYLQLLSFYIFIKYLTSISTSIFVILNKQQFNLVFTIINAFVAIVSFTIGGMMKNELLAIGLLSLFGGISYIIFSLLAFNKVGLAFDSIRKNIQPYLILSLSLLSLMMFSRIFKMTNIFIIMTDILALVIYYSYTIFKQEDLKLLLFSKLLKSYNRNPV